MSLQAVQRAEEKVIKPYSEFASLHMLLQLLCKAEEDMGTCMLSIE